MRAQAVVAAAPGKVEFRQVNTPDPGPQDVVIQVEYSWISNGTESSFMRGERVEGDTPRLPHHPLPFPHVPGYQKTGIVLWAGEQVEHIAPGDQVFATISAVEDMFYPFGGHISPAVTHCSQVWKLPKGMESEAACCLTLLQVGCNAGFAPMMAAHDRALILGDGQVGLWCAQAVQLRRARIMLAGRHLERLALFQPGPEDAVLPSPSNLPEAAADWAPEGLQAVIDTTGDLDALLSLLPCMRHSGQIVSVGFYGVRGQLDLQLLRQKELVLYSPSGWNKGRMDQTLHLLHQKKLSTLPLITHRFEAEQAAQAYALLLQRSEPHLGITLHWQEAASL